MNYQPTVERDFYLVRDLCAITGLCKPSVIKGIEKGELPGYKVGNRYVIPGEAFRALYEGRWAPQSREATNTPESEEPLESPRDPGQFLRRIEDYGHAV